MMPAKQLQNKGNRVVDEGMSSARWRGGIDVDDYSRDLGCLADSLLWLVGICYI